MQNPVVHSTDNPLPFEAKFEVVDELCSCGHLRSSHTDSPSSLVSLRYGYGSCGVEYCDCKQYTYEKFMTKADIELREMTKKRDRGVRYLESAISVIFQLAFLTSRSVSAVKKKKTLIELGKKFSLLLEKVKDAPEPEVVEPEFTKGTMKVGTWLDKMVDGHSIYLDKLMRENFKVATGKDAPWTAESWDTMAAAAIEGGGTMSYDSQSEGGMVCGDDIIKSCHSKFCTLEGELRSDHLRGRGSRARQMVTEISESGN